jgi:hypothetical protein
VILARPTFRQGCRNQQCSDALTAELRQHSHAEQTAMPADHHVLADDIAPANDLAAFESNEMRIAVTDVAQREFDGVFHWRRFKESQVPLLARYNGHGVAKPFDVLGRDAFNRCHGPSLGSWAQCGQAYGASAPVRTGMEAYDDVIRKDGRNA